MSLAELHLKLLGPFQARLEDGRQVELKLKRARLLLSWLALRPKQSGSREELAALLWSDRSEAQAHQSLRQTLAVVRAAFEGETDAILAIDRERVSFRADAVRTDVGMLLSSHADSPIEQLEQAVDQYGGEFLEGLSFRDSHTQEWLRDRRGELRASATRRYEWLLANYERHGRHADAEPIAARLIDIDPLAEEGHRSLIRALLAGGKRSLAIRQYQLCRDILTRELGIEPSPETKALIRRAAEPVAAGIDTAARRPPEPVLTRTHRAHNLPRQMTSLVGRDAELSEILSRLRRYRLVTLTGSGGAGKTRVAIEAGFRRVGAWADGVWLVELAAISDPQLVGEALCGALGIPVAGERPAIESAVAYLAQKQALLILDNCEHLAAASARLADTVLRACPDIVMLATSRESLSIGGESLYRLPSLAFPAETQAISPAQAITYSAVQLFVDRAGATIDGFAIDHDNAPAIASICKQADGIPLAIELAVGRLKMMRPDWLAQNLSETFLTLRGATWASTPHHRTLRTMLDWSYDLLPANEQTLLRGLAVFGGGCTLASATYVIAGTPASEHEMFDLLSSLVEKSLVNADLSGPEPRYRMLETTRRYALDKQREHGEPGRQRELTQYLVYRFTEAGENWPRTPTIAWLARHEPELDNLRTSLEWAFGDSGETMLGVQLASHGIRLWDELSLFRERQRWVDMAIARVDQDTPAAIAGRLYLAKTSNSANGDQSGFSFAGKAAQLFRSIDRPLDLGEALARSGAALLTVDTIEQSLPHLDAALALLEALGPTKPLANCLRSKGVAAYLGGDFAAARALIGRSMVVCRSVGDSRGAASAQIALAELDFSAGNIESAIDGTRRMLEGRDHNRRQETLGLANLASYLLAAGSEDEARLMALDSLREARALGWPGAIVRASEHLALVAALHAETELAARLLGFTDAFYAKGTASREHTEQVTYNRLTDELSLLLPPDRLTALMQEGAGMNDQQAAEAAATLGQTSRPSPGR